MIDSNLIYQKSSVIALLLKVVSYENDGYYWVALLINDNF